MPMLVYIGITASAEVYIRMSELYSFGIPLPFECTFAGNVISLMAVES